MTPSAPATLTWGSPMNIRKNNMPISQDSPKVRVALIGAGGISHAHARAMLQIPEKIVCTAICDLVEINGNGRNQQLGGAAKLYRDWRMMLEEMGDEIDAVVICLPHHLHAPAILDTVRAGKHILCEKPLCINLEEADRIVEAVRDSGICFMAAHNQLFLPVVREARRLIDTGLIGEVRWLRSIDAFLNSGISADQWRANTRFQGGGELIDTGYHPTYRLLYLAGSPVAEVKAVMGRFQLPIEGEDSASVVLSFANGAIGEIMSSWAWQAPHGSHQIHVLGSEGQLFGSNNVLYHKDNDDPEPHKHELAPTDTFAAQMEAFADCILHQQRPPHSVEESRTVLQVILNASKDADGWQQRAARKINPARPGVLAGEPAAEPPPFN